MNIRDLIDQLEQIADQHGDEVEVRYASQPSWPFEYSLSQQVVVSDPGAEWDEDNGEPPTLEDGSTMFLKEQADAYAQPKIVYLAEGSQLAYLPGVVARELGWGR